MLGARQTIGELKVRGVRRDTAALRLVLTRALEQNFEHPSRLPPSAVLLIRRLTDPLPGILGARDIDRKTQASWRSALHTRLDELIRSAVRPNEHGIVADGDAVLFPEETLMIAALARNLMSGQAQPWWCKLLLRGLAGSGRARLRDLLGRQPQQMPAVFDCLVQWGTARSVAAALTEDDATDLIGVLIDVYDLDAMSAELRRVEQRHATIHVGQYVSPLGNVGEITDQPDTRLPWPAHWTVLPGRPRATCLVELALTLQRHPQQARTAGFARCLATLWIEVSPSDTIHSRQTTVTNNERTPLGLTSQRCVQVREMWLRQPPNETEPIPAPVGVDKKRLVAAKTANEDVEWISSFQGEVDQIDDQTTPETAWPWLEQTHTPVATPQRETVPQDRADDASESPVDRDLPIRSSFINAGVPTEWGGVLFLINLLEYLNLPECFEPAWGLEQRLGPWGLLELIGCALLEAAPSTDALWEELARLDGRDPHEPPGGPDSGDVPPDYLLPADWARDTTMESDILWRVTDGRLCIWYRDEYVIFDGAAEKRPMTQIADHLNRLNLPSAALRHGFSDNLPQPRLDHWRARQLAPDLLRWLSLIVPYLHLRLRLAAGDGATDIEALLRCPGRLYVDRTHVDLVAGLDAINLTVRRAGLDRDPGWQARYGRIVSFHFE